MDVVGILIILLLLNDISPHFLMEKQCVFSEVGTEFF
jgi:hypothetical protein